LQDAVIIIDTDGHVTCAADLGDQTRAPDAGSAVAAASAARRI
jgi:hypothetical protein